MNGSAIFGKDNGGGEHSLYRYWLERLDLLASDIHGNRPFIVCGLNPSTATATVNDPTITREIGFAKRERCNRLVKVNAYPYRATKPADMWVADVRGTDIYADNTRYIEQATDLAWMDDGIFVVAWGSHPPRAHERKIWDIIRAIGVTPMCFDTNNDGSPTHPLYQPADKALREWSLPAMPKKGAKR